MIATDLSFELKFFVLSLLIRTRSNIFFLQYQKFIFINIEMAGRWRHALEIIFNWLSFIKCCEKKNIGLTN